MSFSFFSHPEVAGRHAFLSASKYHWINYDEERMERTFTTVLAAMRGSQEHEYAAMAIKLRKKQPRTQQTLNMYINDAIGYRMLPELVLKVSENAFGTADAICYRINPDTGRMMLRIHDLKTGVTKCKPEQLYVYTAFFCLEYGVLPSDIDIELRIYQNDDIAVYIPDPEEIVRIMSKVIAFDKRLKAMREEAQD